MRRLRKKKKNEFKWPSPFETRTWMVCCDPEECFPFFLFFFVWFYSNYSFVFQFTIFCLTGCRHNKSLRDLFNICTVWIFKLFHLYVWSDLITSTHFFFFRFLLFYIRRVYQAITSAKLLFFLFFFLFCSIMFAPMNTTYDSLYAIQFNRCMHDFDSFQIINIHLYCQFLHLEWMSSYKQNEKKKIFLYYFHLIGRAPIHL